MIVPGVGVICTQRNRSSESGREGVTSPDKGVWGMPKVDVQRKKRREKYRTECQT